MEHTMNCGTAVHIDLNVEDVSIVKTIKSLLKSLRGVEDVRVSSPKTKIDVTKTEGYKEAMEDVAAGRITTWASFDEFAKAMEEL